MSKRNHGNRVTFHQGQSDSAPGKKSAHGKEKLTRRRDGWRDPGNGSTTRPGSTNKHKGG